MQNTKYSIDLSPHKVPRTGNIFRKYIRKYMRPYPQADLFFIEDAPIKPDYQKEIQQREKIKRAYNQSGYSSQELKKLISPAFIEALSMVKPRDILFEMEFYREKEYLRILNDHRIEDYLYESVITDLIGGSFDEKLVKLKMSRKLQDITNSHRENTILSQLPEYCNDKNIESVYTIFGIDHRGLLKLPNSHARVIEVCPRWEHARAPLTDEILLRQFMTDLIGSNMTTGKLLNKFSQAFDVVSLLTIEDLKDTGYILEKKFRELNSWPKLSETSTIVKNTFANKLKELDLENQIPKLLKN